MRTQKKEPEAQEEDQERGWRLRRKGRSKFEKRVSLRVLKLPQRNKEKEVRSEGRKLYHQDRAHRR